MNKEGYQLTGKNVQGYKISKPIGQGKFSIVYKAQNEEGVPFALKKIKIFDMADQKQRQKCLKQVDLMKPLNHPNIIQYIDSFIHNNQLIIVTQWADKGDLKRLIRQHQEDEIPFQQATIWKYMKQISSALMHMHDKRIMHRDLKPANIFISSDMTLKIGDLGLGRSFSSETLQAYSKVGTPLYMSPELIQDSGYNQNADVWSLGCIIYELCQLNSPFRNKKEKMSLMDLFENITKCNYKPISSKYSQQLSQAIKQMIVVDPSKRWSSEQVVNLADKMISNQKKSKLDPIITMDDIHIKLGLLNYTTYFCNVAEKKPLNKFYFALKDAKCGANEQLFYLLQLCYWIMSLSKPNQKKDKLALYSKTLIDWKSPENGCIKFLADLNNFGVKTEDIQMQHIKQGYGQSACYLLNQVLNRELIRTNFQFQKPTQNQSDTNNKQVVSNNQIQLKDQQVQQPMRQLSDQDFEQQSQFQQSIFFNKNQRKNKNIGGDLLQKIQQFDNQQDNAIIYGKIEEKQWRLQCERLTKKFTQMSSMAKQMRKKHSYHNFETVKVSTSKLVDLINYVKPASALLVKNVDQQLTLIHRQQQVINAKHKSIGMGYLEQNGRLKDLSNRQAMLTSSIKQSSERLSQCQQKLSEFQLKIDGASQQQDSTRRISLKSAIQRLRIQMKQMQQKRGIVEWQVNKCRLKYGKIQNNIDEPNLEYF